MNELRWWLWRPPRGAKYIGKRGLVRKDAGEKASGRAIFTRDVTLPRMIYAKPFLSPYAHCRISWVNEEKLGKVRIEGLIAVIRWDDEEFKDKWPRIYGSPYLSDQAEYYGQPVGFLVVGETEEACDDALKVLGECIRWQVLSFRLHWDSDNPEREIFPSIEWSFGDVHQGFSEADQVIEFTVRKTEEDTWAGVEGGVAVANYLGNKVEIWHYGQAPFRARSAIANALGIPEACVIIHTPYHGALFGGVTWIGYPDALAVIAALLSRRFGRPVKVLDDYTTFRGAEWQLGTYKFKVGFKADGTITAVELETTLVGIPHEPTILKLLKSTKIPNIKLRARWPFVNRPPRICYRHGAHFCNVVTYVVNRVAAELGMDPTEVALINDGCHGQSMTSLSDEKAKEGFNPYENSLRKVLEVGKKAIGWDRIWHKPGERKLPNGKYHGVGFMAVEQWAWVPFPVGDLPKPISAAIRFHKDGSAEILGLRADGGVGFSTSYAQVVADELGIPFEAVVHKHNEDCGFALWPMGGSAGAVSNLIVIILASRRAKAKLLEVATQILEPFRGKSAEELDVRDGYIVERRNPGNRIPLSAVTSRVNVFASADLSECIDAIAGVAPWDFYAEAGFQPRIFEISERFSKPNWVRQAHFVEIEVDPDTGRIEVKRVVVVNDVGKAINPDIINGQQYGGAYMGLGRNHMEAVYYDPLTGVRLSDNLLEYKVPLLNDFGGIECHIVESGLGYGPYGMTGCGESVGAALSMILAPAVYNAIGVWIDDFPITPDKVIEAINRKEKKS